MVSLKDFMPKRILSQNLRARLFRKRSNVIADDTEHLRVTSRKQTHGPIRTKQEPFFAKREDYDAHDALIARSEVAPASV